MVGVGALVQGTHACCRFTDERGKRSVVSAFVADGLRRNERVAVYTRGGDGAELLPGSVRESDASRLIESGQLVLASAEDAYFGENGFDAEEQIAQFSSYTDATVNDGYAGLRVYADNGWMPAALEHPGQWLEYELMVSRMIAGRPLIGLCGFDVADDGPLSARAIDAVHPVSVPGEGETAASFHLVRDGDTIALRGEVDSFAVDELRAVLDAARPLLVTDQLSLAGVRFVDAAGAHALLSFMKENRVAVRDVSPALRKVWRVLGLSAQVPLQGRRT